MAEVDLPDGFDDDEYKRIRRLMWGTVLRVWTRGPDVVVAGIDPWIVVDEAWVSMAERGFQSTGPFEAHACAVAKNKALDALKRAEVKRAGPSPDATRQDGEGNEVPIITSPSAPDAEGEYLARLHQVEEAEKVVLIEAAMHEVLTDAERSIFLQVRQDGKSCAAVGRETDPIVTGQRIGQIVARAVMKIQEYIATHDSDGESTAGVATAEEITVE